MLCTSAARKLTSALRVMHSSDPAVRALTISCLERLRLEDANCNARRVSSLIWHLPAAAALLSALSLSRPTSLCEANRVPPEESKKRLLQAWDQLDQDLYREEASLPFPFVPPRPRKPTVTCGPERVVVRIPVRDGADLTTILNEMGRAFSKWCSPRAEQDAGDEGRVVAKITEDDNWRMFHFECSAAGSGSAEGLSAKVLVSKWQPSNAEIEFNKTGSLSEADMDILITTMRVANTIVDQGQGQISIKMWQSGLDDIHGELTGLLREVEKGFNIGFSLFPELEKHLSREMQRVWGDQAGTSTRDDEEILFQFPDRPSDAVKARRPQQRTVDSAEQEDPHNGYGTAEAAQAAERLLQLGVSVNPPGKRGAIDWGALAGYEDQKRTIEDTVLLALLHPEVYDEVAKGTRQRQVDSTRPRAVLFEGPPGCGKTTSARVIASQAAVPLVYVPLEAVASKWYGESERNLSEIFKAAEQLGGAIIFLDEIDSLATQRSSEMHEATRRLLGVLLRQMDGFGPQSRSIIIGATNRRQDLDPALLSRFDASVTFGYPSEECRGQILRQFARHLTDEEIGELAKATGDAQVSGRDLRDIAEQTERRWASKIVRGLASKGELPPLSEYREAAAKRVEEKAAPRLKNLMPAYH